MSETEERRPIEEVLPGLMVHALDEGESVEFAFVLIKTSSKDGSGWSYRTSAAPNREELLGALKVQASLLEREMLSEWDAE